MLGVVTEEVAKHIHHEDHRADQVEHSCNNGMPEALRVRLTRPNRRGMSIESHSNSDELYDIVSEIQTLT
jgi:hypothetical protein